MRKLEELLKDGDHPRPRQEEEEEEEELLQHPPAACVPCLRNIIIMQEEIGVDMHESIAAMQTTSRTSLRAMRASHTHT